MKDSAIKLSKRISEYLRARCNTKDYLLNQDCCHGSQSGPSELDGTANRENFISLLNSALGPTEYFMQ
jgi:hypothetical protein